MSNGQAVKVLEAHGLSTHETEAGKVLALVHFSTRDEFGNVRHGAEWEAVPTGTQKALLQWLGY